MQVLSLIAGRPQGMSTRELARRLEVTSRTIERDLLYLQVDYNAPLVQVGRLWRVPHGYQLPPIVFDLQEATALLIGARLMARYADKANAFAVTAYQKLAAALPTETKLALSEVADELSALPVEETFTRVMTTLVRAWAEHRKVVITYTSMSRGPFDRQVWPLFIEPSSSGHTCYLIAWDEHDGQGPRAKNYRIERIAGVQLLDDRFSPPLGFSLARHLAHAWTIWNTDQRPVPVELEFDASIAERVQESRWHHSQELSQRADGSLRARFLVADTTEIRPWILSWGAKCRVIRPAALRDEVASELEATLARYGRGLMAPAVGRAAG
jgi:predicted DNA-binding transcriptional regulator YafY